ncbi:TetR/AcrR family transcriptional regulator [Nocardia sp. CA-107356]|uniref:TetR/AcrR family transcriptional regulator n=1 Tax=Nocardia sp. CA-107356 TaxID=3239972 RepID=UPI003D8E8F92
MRAASRGDSISGGGRVAGGPEDKRLLRGARSRQLVLRQAVDTASLDGLDGLSFGKLATDTGLSKAGVQTLFKTKETLQLAALDLAREMFIDAVIRPARAQPQGVQRLRALIEHWINYAETPLFAGGCYRVANMADFDSRPGPVRDALVRDQQDWMSTIARELRRAVDAGDIADLDTDLAAFQIDAVLCSANTALRLGDTDAAHKVRRVVESFLTQPE